VRLLILLSCLLAGCGLYTPRVTISVGARVADRDTGPVTCLELEQRVAAHTSLGWAHCSDIRRGAPFNTREDLSHDVFVISRSWGGKPK
jgi:hypothetical protein